MAPRKRKAKTLAVEKPITTSQVESGPSEVTTAVESNTECLIGSTPGMSEVDAESLISDQKDEETAKQQRLALEEMVILQKKHQKEAAAIKRRLKQKEARDAKKLQKQAEKDLEIMQRRTLDKAKNQLIEENSQQNEGKGKEPERLKDGELVDGSGGKGDEDEEREEGEYGQLEDVEMIDGQCTKDGEEEDNGEETEEKDEDQHSDYEESAMQGRATKKQHREASSSVEAEAKVNAINTHHLPDMKCIKGALWTQDLLDKYIHQTDWIEQLEGRYVLVSGKVERLPDSEDTQRSRGQYTLSRAKEEDDVVLARIACLNLSAPYYKVGRNHTNVEIALRFGPDMLKRVRLNRLVNSIHLPKAFAEWKRHTLAKRITDKAIRKHIPSFEATAEIAESLQKFFSVTYTERSIQSRLDEKQKAAKLFEEQEDKRIADDPTHHIKVWNQKRIEQLQQEAKKKLDAEIASKERADRSQRSKDAAALEKQARQARKDKADAMDLECKKRRAEADLARKDRSAKGLEFSDMVSYSHDSLFASEEEAPRSPATQAIEELAEKISAEQDRLDEYQHHFRP